MDRTAHEIAEELSEVRKELNILKGIDKKLSDELKSHMKAGEEQGFFRFVQSNSLEIVDLSKALKWAKKWAPTVITVNTTDARKIFLQNVLTGSFGTPEKAGFAFKTTEKLQEIRGAVDE